MPQLTKADQYGQMWLYWSQIERFNTMTDENEDKPKSAYEMTPAEREKAKADLIKSAKDRDKAGNGNLAKKVEQQGKALDWSLDRHRAGQPPHRPFG